jgi:hypothetical protein
MHLDQHVKGGGEAVELAGAYLSVDPAGDSPYPSSCRNSARFFGVDERVRENDLDAIIDIFQSRGIQRFHFWLSPCVQATEIEGWLGPRGFEPFQGTGYPTLRHQQPAVSHPEPELEVRLVRGEEARHAAELLLGDHGHCKAFAATIGASGIDHFIAFDGDRPVASSLLCTTGGISYLSHGHTLEADRNRGAQTGMIRARVERGRELGSRHIVSETLFMLETSLHNLQRCGFQIIYEKRVFVWQSPVP